MMLMLNRNRGCAKAVGVAVAVLAVAHVAAGVLLYKSARTHNPIPRWVGRTKRTVKHLVREIL